MTDHYRKAVECLEEVADHRKELDVIHLSRQAKPALVAKKYDAIRTGLQLAKIHAQLAEVQALHDLRAVVESGARSGLTHV